MATAAPAAAQQSSGGAVVVFRTTPSAIDLRPLDVAQLPYQTLKHLPIALVRSTPDEVRALISGSNVLTIRRNAVLEPYLDESVSATGAPRVWNELGVTGWQIGIAVLDSGISARHPDLQLHTKVLQNVDVRTAPAEAASGEIMTITPFAIDSDTTGHGTLVASAAAGSGRASDGRYAGVARNAHLVGIGGGEILTTFWALTAFDWILEHHEQYAVRVVNTSWGLSGPFDPSAPINLATRALYEAGLTVVFAAGNGGPAQQTLNSFSVAPWVIGVAAGTNDRSLAAFSSRGVPGDPLYHPTITAPGVQVVAARDASSFMGAVVGAQGDEPYMAISGTSLAAPQVAGVVALLLEANSRLTPDAIKSILVRTADPMPGYGEHEVGAGFVNALEAVRLARS